MRTNDTVSGVVLLLLAALVVALTLNFPAMPGQKYGPSLFPRLLGAGLAVCGLLLILRDRRVATTAAALGAPAWVKEPWRVVSFALVLLAPLVAIAGWERIGFVPLAFATLLVLFLWFRVRPATAVATAVLATVLLQLFFGKAMRVPLPLGWLLQLPPGWLKYLT
jgi:putative tricarboxylic transport membrane protein